jgi:hypothetical protein
MKKPVIFLLYLLLGIFIIFSYKKINEIINSNKLKTPLPESSFSLETAPNDSLKGTITSLSGDVSWQSRIATEPAKITKPIQVQQGEKILTKEKSLASIVFSNRVTIIIQPKTEIDLIQTLPENIVIGQNIGNAEYIKTNNNSLSIRTLDLLIKINQGNIKVSVSENQPYIIISVKSGSITLGYNDINYITQVVNVETGKQLTFRTDTKKISIIPF